VKPHERRTHETRHPTVIKEVKPQEVYKTCSGYVTVYLDIYGLSYHYYQSVVGAETP
jgi:hypothetical protein